MKITLENVKNLADGLWATSVSQTELAILKDRSKQEMDLSVLVVGNASFDSRNKQISFDIADGVLTNEGSTGSLLIVQRGLPSLDKSAFSRAAPYPVSDKHLGRVGDNSYLRELDAVGGQLAEAGRSLLKQVRTFYEDPLQPSKSGMFVQRPENFWTVKVQPRVRTLAISVYGRPDVHKQKVHSIDIKQGLPSYSRLTVRNLRDANEAAKVIRHAWDLKLARKRN